MKSSLWSARLVHMRQVLTTALFPILWLGLPGCVGSGWLFTETTFVPHPVISEEKGRIWFKTDMASQPVGSTLDLRRLWGDPDAIESGHLEETWIYKFGLRWNGVVMVFGGPLPLAVPVGRNHISFQIDADQRVVSATMKDQQDDGLVCSVLPRPDCYDSAKWMCAMPWLCRPDDRPPSATPVLAVHSPPHQPLGHIPRRRADPTPEH